MRAQTADKPAIFSAGFIFSRIGCFWPQDLAEGVGSFPAYAVAGFGAFVRAIAIFLMFWADAANQLTLRADAEQVANEQRLEHQSRIERRAAVVGAIKLRNAIAGEREVDHRVDLAKQMSLRHKAVEISISRAVWQGPGFFNISQ